MEDKKRIKLTEEELKKFYFRVNLEKACDIALSNEIVEKIVESKLPIDEYLDAAINKHGEVYADSELYLMELRKKYNVKAFVVDEDELIEQ